ncbi:hypothetical protein VaNZ11_002254 [Volvox africanus]|uniref:SBP-type domain-containing protein n=1 Tax=Volvox africanus TaxID=51714 RepID=A0ABQ5RSA2_9CHLO|nr:hypothetical protein VaNZ11_002254 [Volvox africanus]
MKDVETALSETQERLEVATDLPVISKNYHDASYHQSVAGYRRSSAPLRCKVSGCSSDLASAPKTHQRFRLCNLHIKAPAILVDGVASRFCQQCSRFHPLTEFHGTNRTCRMMLVKNRARQRGINPCNSPHGAFAVQTAGQQSAPPCPLLPLHAAAGEKATSTAANMAPAGVSAAGWGRAFHALDPTLTQPGESAASDWQAGRTHPVGLAGAAAGAAATASCLAAGAPPADKPALLAIQPPEGQPCNAPPVSTIRSSRASSEQSPVNRPSALAAPTATPAVAGARLAEPPGLQHATSAGGHLAGVIPANQTQPLSCTDSKSYRSCTMALIMPAVSPPPVPCSPAILVSEVAPSIPRTSSVSAVEARCVDGVSVPAGASPGPGARGGQADTAMTESAAAATEVFARSPFGTAAVTLAASSTMMATSLVSAFASERELCIGSELGTGDRHSLRNGRAASRRTSASLTASASPFARCSAPPALCQPDCENVGGQTLNVLRHWQRQMEQDPDQLSPLQQLQAERKSRHYPLRGTRLCRRPSAPQWERSSLQRTILRKQTCSSLRTCGDMRATSTSLVHGSGGPDEDDGGLLGGDGYGDGELSWWSVENSTASLGDDDCGGIGIGGGSGGSCNGNGIFPYGGSGDSSMLGRMSAPLPDTANLQTDLRCIISSNLLMNSTSVAAVGCGLSALGALRESGGGGGDISWGLQRAGSFGNCKRRRSLGSESAGDDGAGNVRHCSNADLAEPALDAAVLAGISGAEDEGSREHSYLAPQLPVSALAQGMAALSASQQHPALATMMLGLGETPDMVARCAHACHNTTDYSNNMPTAEPWSPGGCLQNSGSPNDHGDRGGRCGNGGGTASGRRCHAGDGRACPLSQPSRPRWTHTAAEGQCLRNLSLNVTSAADVTSSPAVFADDDGGSRGDGAQLTPRAMASLVLDSLALDEKMEQGAIHTTAAPSGAAACAVSAAVATDKSGTKHNTATGATGSPSAVHADSLLLASLAAEWQGEDQPDDGVDELLLGLDEPAAAGSLIRCRHVDMSLQSQSPSITTMAIQQPQQVVQQLPLLNLTEPVGTGLLLTGCTSAAALTSSFVRSTTAASWWSESSCSSQKATEVTTAMHRERSIAPDVEMMAASGPHTRPMVKPPSGAVFEDGGPFRPQPGSLHQHMWFRSAQSEPAWGSRSGDMVWHHLNQLQQTPPHYRQHRLGQPLQPPLQQQHQQQHQLAAQQASCNIEDRDRTVSSNAGGRGLGGICCHQQQDILGAGTSNGLSNRKAIGEETEEQLQLLLGDLIGSDTPLQPRLAVAVAAQPTLLLPTPATTNSLLQQLQQQYYSGISHVAIASSRQQPPPPPLLPRSPQQPEQGPLVLEFGAGSGSGSGPWGAKICASDMLIDYPSQFVAASLAVSGGSSETAQKAALPPSTDGADAARYGLHAGPQQHPHLHQHQYHQQQRLSSYHEGLSLRDEQAVAEVTMTDTATALQLESSEAIPSTAATAATTASIAGGDSTPIPCLRSQHKLQQQQHKQQHVSSGHSGSSTRHSRRSHRCTNSAGYGGLHDGVSSHDRDFLDMAVQQQQQLWSELRSMQEQQRALLEQQMEQQRALAKLLGGALHVAAGSIASPAAGDATATTVAGNGAGDATAATAAAGDAIDGGVGCDAAAYAKKTAANSLSLLEARQKQKDQEQQQQEEDGEQLAHDGGGGGSCSSLMSHLQPAVPAFGRWSMPVLSDGGNMGGNISFVELQQQPGSRLQQRQRELPDGLEPQPQEHSHELALPTRCHGRHRFTRHIHQSHQPLDEHRLNKQQSSPRGTSSPAVLSPDSHEGPDLSGGCSGGVSSCM